MSKNGNGNGRHKHPQTIRCRACGGDLVKDSPAAVRVEQGKIAGIDGGYEDWDPQTEAWGYMHLQCFYLAVGDPRGVLADAHPI